MKVSGSKGSSPKVQSEHKSESSRKTGSRSEREGSQQVKHDRGVTQSVEPRRNEPKTDTRAEQARTKDAANEAQAGAAAQRAKLEDEKKAAERAALEAKSPTLQAINRGTSDYEANSVESGAVDLKGGVRAQSIEQQRADAEKRAQVEEVLRQTGPGRAALDRMREHGVQPELGPGKESYWDGQRMVLGRDQNAHQAAEAAIHETHHMVADRTGATPDPSKVSRDEYVNAMLREEADATAQALEARRELQSRGVAPEGPAPALEKPFREAYERELATRQGQGSTVEEAQAAARAAGHDAVLKAFQDGSAVTSVDGQGYGDYYGKAWDEVRAGRTAATSVVRPNPDPAASTAPRDRIGLNDNVGYFVPAAGDPPDIRTQKATELDNALRQDAANGVKDIRLTVEVDVRSGVLKRPGDGAALTAADLAGAAQEAEKRGITLLVNFKPSTDSVDAMSGRDADGARNYARSAADVAGEIHRRGLTAHYELGNEPNTNSHWPDGGNRDPARMDQLARQYMTYEKAAYDAVKGAQGLSRDPATGDYPPPGENGSRVMMAGLSHVDTEFLDRLYKNGLASHTDVINMHPYNAGNTPADFVSNMERIRATMLENGDTKNKLWLTEIGSQYDERDPGAQGRYMDAMTASMPNYVEKVYWFNKVDVDVKAGGNVSDAGAYGLTEYDGTPRAAWTTLGERIRADNDPNNLQQRPRAIDSALTSTYAQYAPVLGRATAEAATDPATGRITQQFENGSLSYEPATGAYDVNTRLGHPTRANYNGEEGHTIHFENGSVVFDKHTGSHTVTPGSGDPRGGTFDPFTNDRTTYQGELGSARGAPFYEANGNLKQLFENGYILQAPGGGVEVYQGAPPRRLNP